MNISFNTERDHPADISDKDFQRLIAYVHAQCGIEVPLDKKNLLTDMVRERLRHLGRHSFKEYIDWLLGTGQSGEELIQFVHFATARDIGFFHEADRFEFMAQTAVPELIKFSGAGISRDCMIWSAGCSTGEEAYTLAMVLREFASHYPGIQFKAQVLATDLSDQALSKASNAVYGMEEVAPIAMELKRKYLLKSKDSSKRLVRIVPELRQMVKFRRLNIMDAEFGLREQMDIIFCRHVITHFNRPTRERLVNKMCRHLSPGGYLFLGDAESLDGLRVPVVQSAPTIYRMPQ
ncbi:MAG: methyltransferase domain-containing protein [Magnetococcus sp. XQGC-1]